MSEYADRMRSTATSSKLVNTLLGMAGLVVTGLVIGFSRHSSDLWPVAVPGLLTGIGTLGLAYGTFSVLRGDQQDRRDRENRELRDQASRVHPGIPQLMTTPSDDVTQSTMNYMWQVDIANNSEYPIRNIETIIIETWENLDLAIKATEPPNPILRSDYKQLQSHEQRLMPFYELQFATTGPKYVGTNLPTPSVAVVFTDINGKRWLRSPDWRLHDVTGNPELAERIVSGWAQTPPAVERVFKDIWRAHYGDQDPAL